MFQKNKRILSTITYVAILGFSIAYYVIVCIQAQEYRTSNSDNACINLVEALESSVKANELLRSNWISFWTYFFLVISGIGLVATICKTFPLVFMDGVSWDTTNQVAAGLATQFSMIYVKFIGLQHTSLCQGAGVSSQGYNALILSYWADINLHWILLGFFGFLVLTTCVHEVRSRGSYNEGFCLGLMKCLLTSCLILVGICVLGAIVADFYVTVLYGLFAFNETIQVIAWTRVVIGGLGVLAELRTRAIKGYAGRGRPRDVDTLLIE